MKKKQQKKVFDQPEISEDKEGLGDQVKKVIKKVLPKVASKYENCEGCEKRRKFLNNNFNAVFR